MCEARVVLKSDGADRTVMEDAAAVIVDGSKLVVRNILGDRVEVEARIERVDLVSNLIVLRQQ